MNLVDWNRERTSNRRVIIVNTHGEYWTGTAWAKPRKDALAMTEREALVFLDATRTRGIANATMIYVT